jgi:hypothetical protein
MGESLGLGKVAGPREGTYTALSCHEDASKGLGGYLGAAHFVM